MVYLDEQSSILMAKKEKWTDDKSCEKINERFSAIVKWEWQLMVLGCVKIWEKSYPICLNK